ncbi:MAG: HD domain-containing phosphohydrolase [Candidatus Cloacimonadia bacterium]
MLTEKQKLEEIIKLGNLMTQIKDVDILMETILSEAKKFTQADAGSIYRCEENTLFFNYTQNNTLLKRLEPGKKLIYSTFKMPIDSKSIAGYVAETGQILNLPDVYHLPQNVPYSFNKEFDKTSDYKTTSVLTIPLKTNGDRIVGVLQLINAQDDYGEIIPFLEEDIPLVKHFANNAAVALERAEMTRAIILRMIKVAELRDPKETGAHANRVGAYSAEIYEEWATRKGKETLEIKRNKDTIRIAAMLHDIGKVAIPDAILKKPSKLTDEEYAVMKTHACAGAQLFMNKQSELDEMSQEIALNHHERWDGFGYPGHVDFETEEPLPGFKLENGKARGKEKEEISLWARIVSISDVYDALSSRRSYKSAWTEEDVINEMVNQAGKQFDPELIDIFVDIIDVLRSVRQKYPDEEAQ